MSGPKSQVFTGTGDFALYKKMKEWGIEPNKADFLKLKEASNDGSKDITLEEFQKFKTASLAGHNKVESPRFVPGKTLEHKQQKKKQVTKTKQEEARLQEIYAHESEPFKNLLIDALEEWNFIIKHINDPTYEKIVMDFIINAEKMLEELERTKF